MRALSLIGADLPLVEGLAPGNPMYVLIEAGSLLDPDVIGVYSPRGDVGLPTIKAQEGIRWGRDELNARLGDIAEAAASAYGVTLPGGLSYPWVEAICRYSDCGYRAAFVEIVPAESDLLDVLRHCREGHERGQAERLAQGERTRPLRAPRGPLYGTSPAVEAERRKWPNYRDGDYEVFVPPS